MMNKNKIIDILESYTAYCGAGDPEWAIPQKNFERVAEEILGIGKENFQRPEWLTEEVELRVIDQLGKSSTLHAVKYLWNESKKNMDERFGLKESKEFVDKLKDK